jgi:hypothetical protein
MECGIKTTTTITGNEVTVVVDGDHQHPAPPAAKLLPTSKLKILNLVKEGQKVTGATINFGQVLSNDTAALQESRVSAEVRKAHKLLFGDNLDFGGIANLTDAIIKEDFVRAAVQDISNASKTICFLQTDFQQTAIKSCDYLFGDISYKLCRKYYKMVITGYSHVTHKGVVVATAFLERADAVSYKTMFHTFFIHNRTLATISKRDLKFKFEAFAVDFSDAQRKGFISAVIQLARESGCDLTDPEIETKCLLVLKGCEFHFKQSVTKVAASGALAGNAFRSVFTTYVTHWLNSDSMAVFATRKKQLEDYFPSLKGWSHVTLHMSHATRIIPHVTRRRHTGWIKWWALPVHAVLIFPSVRKDMLGETDDMYGRLPSTNNNSEATNSIESGLCKHNAELVPAIYDSYKMTIRQQRQHEGILNGVDWITNVHSMHEQLTVVSRRCET